MISMNGPERTPGRWGADPHIAERCLNHKIKGVEGTHNRHDYYEERSAALNLWASFLGEIGERGEVWKRGADEASKRHDFYPPRFPPSLPLPCFFSGTSGTLRGKSSVSLAVTGLELSHSEWDTGLFLGHGAGHFKPDATPRAVLRMRRAGQTGRRGRKGDFRRETRCPAACYAGGCERVYLDCGGAYIP